MRRGRVRALPQIHGLAPAQFLGTAGSEDIFGSVAERTGEALLIKVSTEDLASVGAVDREIAVLQTLDGVAGVSALRGSGMLSDGRHYLVTAPVEGVSLAQALGRGPYAADPAIRLVIATAEVLGRVHTRGLAHRDVNPATIFIGPTGPLLLGFALAAPIGSPIAPKGASPPWAPPEILRGGGVVDVRADVYSLTATLYTMLAGRAPFQDGPGATPGAAAAPPVGRADLPRGTEDVLAAGLAREPSDRPATIAALSGLLVGVLAGAGER
jgi:serine/threonine protein kinase